VSERQPVSQIPTFASREDEARFWDAHDVTDFLGELEPVRVQFSSELSDGILVQLDPDTLRELRRAASTEGIETEMLARRWIVERLKAPSA
jgi:hypothetical protein